MRSFPGMLLTTCLCVVTATLGCSVADTLTEPEDATLPVHTFAGDSIAVTVGDVVTAPPSLSQGRISWVSDPKILELRSNGSALAVSAGKAWVVAFGTKKNRWVKDSILVRVRPPKAPEPDEPTEEPTDPGADETEDTTSVAVASIRLEVPESTLEIGESTRIRARLFDADGNRLRDRSVKWTTANSRVATVSESGTVTARRPGTSRITATSEGVSASTDITVVEAPPTEAPPPAPEPEEPLPTAPNPTEPPPSQPPADGSQYGDHVALTPGADIQRAVNDNPAGTVFVLKPGVYSRQSITPKSGNRFIGEPGAILDGGNSVKHAFQPGNSQPRDVVIEGLEIRNYTPGVQLGAILGGGHSRTPTTHRWVVRNNNIHHNDGGGIRIGQEMQVINNHIHHNSQIGIVGIGDDVLVEGNEISYNNFEKKHDYIWEAGGTKFVMTRNLVVRKNYVHNNWGPGLWTDIDNINTLYEDNRVVGNADNGIFHEISYSAVIRNNHVEGNGFDRPSWLWGAGILVSSSGDVEIHGNTVVRNANGIGAVQQNRGSGAYGSYQVKNINVYGNTVDVSAGGRIGVAQDVGDRGVFSSRNIRFSGNTYILGSNSRPFEWMDRQVTESDWRGYGNDSNGTFRR